jgi:hypothetical protein
MKSSYATAKKEVKKLVVKYGIDGIMNYHLNEIRERTGVSVTELQNACSYFRYSPKTAKYRA